MLCTYLLFENRMVQKYTAFIVGHVSVPRGAFVATACYGRPTLFVTDGGAHTCYVTSTALRPNVVAIDVVEKPHPSRFRTSQNGISMPSRTYSVNSNSWHS